MNKIERKSLIYFCLSLFFSFLSYISPIYYNCYGIILFLVFISLLASGIYLLFGIKDKKSNAKRLVKKHKSIIFYFILFLLVNIIQYLLEQYTFYDLLRSLGIFSTFFLFIFIMDGLKKQAPIVLDFFSYLIFASSVVGNLIFLMSKLGFYQMRFGFRVTSIFFDPNYYALLLGLSLIWKKNSSKNKILSLYFFISLLLTGSRGILLSFVVSCFLLFMFKFISKRYKKSEIYQIGLLLVLILIFLFVNPEYLRTHQKWGNRHILFKYGLKKVANNPLFGHGYQGFKNIFTSDSNIGNRSTHNGYIDFMLINGIILFFTLELILIVKVVKESYKFYKEKERDDRFLIYLFMIIFMSVSKLTISYNLGGLGLAAFMYTFIYSSFFNTD